MEHSLIVHQVIFAIVFLSITCLLQLISRRWSSMPYTAMLVLAGIVSLLVFNFFGLENDVKISPDFIYFILLPLLLFESSYHINIHHFRLQFNTVTALATLGLVISIFVVAGILYGFANFSIGQAFLFGAIISSTDPIAVIALFKQLGAPRRLGLVADGESMFNDATSVIAYKVVAAVVLGSIGLSPDFLFSNTIKFLFVFVGSIAYGATLGVIASYLATNLKSNLLALNLVVLTLSLLSFVSADHSLGLSGVITTVSFGIVFGNLAAPLFSHAQESAFDHFWEMLSLIAVSIVFYFSSFSLNFETLAASVGLWPVVIGSVLLGRSISVYLVCWLCNKLPIFKYEPNIPLSWQHVLNWGGLRGVIPLVLAFSLPIDFAMRDLLIALTVACFLFTIFVNGFTIKPLLMILGLHRPAKVEQLYDIQKKLIGLRLRLEKLENLPAGSFSSKLIADEVADLNKQQEEYLNYLNSSEVSEADLYRSFRMAGNRLEREYTKELFEMGYMDKNVFAAFDAQLNQQIDRIEYPDLPHRQIKKDFTYDISTTWRNRVANTLGISPSNRILYLFFGGSTQEQIAQRFSLLYVRLITSKHALNYLNSLERVLKQNPAALRAIEKIKLEQETYIEKNRSEMQHLDKVFPILIAARQKQLLTAALVDMENHPLPVAL